MIRRALRSMHQAAHGLQHVRRTPRVVGMAHDGCQPVNLRVPCYESDLLPSLEIMTSRCNNTMVVSMLSRLVAAHLPSLARSYMQMYSGHRHKRLERAHEYGRVVVVEIQALPDRFMDNILLRNQTVHDTTKYLKEAGCVQPISCSACNSGLTFLPVCLTLRFSADATNKQHASHF